MSAGPWSRWLGRLGALPIVLLLVLGRQTPAAHAYEGEHYVWTYYVALQCGFTERQAYQLASGAYAIDWDPQTGPMPSGPDYGKITWGYPPESQRQIWIRHHAFTENVFLDTGGAAAAEASKQRRMQRLRIIGRIDGNPGALLHYTQDYTPHFGWDDVRGHGPAGHLPDFLIADPPGGWQATQRTIKELIAFAADRGLPQSSCNERRLREVFRPLMEANPLPVDLDGAVKDLRDRINDAVARRLVIGSFTFAQLAGIFVDSGLRPTDIATVFSIGPSLQRSLRVIQRAVQKDKEEGRLETYVDGLPPFFASLPDHWIQYDYDDEGQVHDPRFAVENPTFETGRPTMSAQLTGEGPDARVLIDWSVPFTLGELSALGFLDHLPVQLRSGDPSFAGSTIYVPNGSHVFRGRANVPRSRVDARETVSFEVAAYGLGVDKVALTLEADLPPPKAPEDTDELREMLERLERLTEAAEATAARMRGVCASTGEEVRQLAAQAAALDSDVAGYADFVLAADASASNAPSDPVAAMERASARASSAAQAIAVIRDEAARSVGRACADRVPPPGGLAERARARLEELRDAVLELHALTPGAADPRALRRREVRSELSVLVDRGQLLLDAVSVLHGRLNQASADDETLRATESQAGELVDRIHRFLQRPGADAAGVTPRVDAAWGRVQAAMQSAAGCGEDLRNTELNPLHTRINDTLERAGALQRRLAAVAETSTSPAGLAERIASAEAELAVSELFYESIVNREQEARDCIAGPERESLPPSSDETTDAGGGWSLDDDIVTVDENPEPTTGGDGERSARGGGSDAPPPPPSAEDDIESARGAFARCDFVSALSFARRAQSIDPDHPWLAANLARIEQLAGQQRRTAQMLSQARRLASQGKLKTAREAMRAAAASAPGCMSDSIAGVDRQVATAIAQRRESGREALRDGLGALIGAIGQVAAASGQTPAQAPPPTTLWSAPGAGASSGGSAGGGPSCYAFDARPRLRPVVAGLDDEDRGKVTFFMEEYRLPQGSLYTVTVAGVENYAQLHAMVDQMVRQYGGGVGAPRRYGPYGSLEAAWSAASSRCSNVVRF